MQKLFLHKLRCFIQFGKQIRHKFSGDGTCNISAMPWCMFHENGKAVLRVVIGCIADKPGMVVFVTSCFRGARFPGDLVYIQSFVFRGSAGDDVLEAHAHAAENRGWYLEFLFILRLKCPDSFTPAVGDL